MCCLHELKVHDRAWYCLRLLRVPARVPCSRPLPRRPVTHTHNSLIKFRGRSTDPGHPCFAPLGRPGHRCSASDGRLRATCTLRCARTGGRGDGQGGRPRRVADRCGRATVQGDGEGGAGVTQAHRRRARAGGGGQPARTGGRDRRAVHTCVQHGPSGGRHLKWGRSRDMGADVFWTPWTRVFLPLPDAPPHRGFARDGRNFISELTCREESTFSISTEPC
jgi:hypothetical protein